MEARQIHYRKVRLRDGAIVEEVIWKLPRPVLGSLHQYKYRLFFGIAGKRLIGYDNERGKGDHRHRGESEEEYLFIDPVRLLSDFRGDVERWRADHDNQT
jgi:hypothetical protein